MSLLKADSHWDCDFTAPLNIALTWLWTLFSARIFYAEFAFPSFLQPYLLHFSSIVLNELFTPNAYHVA